MQKESGNDGMNQEVPDLAMPDNFDDEVPF